MLTVPIFSMLKSIKYVKYVKLKYSAWWEDYMLHNSNYVDMSDGKLHKENVCCKVY
jgi:hypothetical protein